MRWALIIEYDGTDFNGSQSQLNARTVQDVIESAAATIFGEGLDRIRLASRTDAGVHAEGQVATLDVATAMSAHEFRDALNGNLPPDVAVLSVCRARHDFDPRRDAIAREYRYTINDNKARSSLRRRYEYHVGRRLDVEAMARVAELFLGVHDFASFAASTTDAGSTIREVTNSSVQRSEDGLVMFDVRANAFVRQQIRRMVAALIAVGVGNRSIAWVKESLGSPVRGAASQAAPARGLTLRRVIYPERA